MRLAEVGEFGFIGRIAGRVAPHAGVRLGIGDDCAITITSSESVTLTTTDLLVEGVHFDFAYSDPCSLGNKALAVNLSDIAAMGGVPRHALLGLAIPPYLTVEFLDAFSEAFITLADRHGVTLVGGDTCSSRNGLLISVTLVGEQIPDRVVTRAGARPGDLLAVSGTLGDAAIGLALLQHRHPGGGSEAARHCQLRHLQPTPRVALGQELAAAGLASSMIDISDGLIADLGHILESSGVGAHVELSRLPLSPAYRELAPDLPGDFWAPALGGGEDYELLFSFPPEREADLPALQESLGISITVIGAVTPEPGLRVVDAAGVSVPCRSQGYDHFPAA